MTEPSKAVFLSYASQDAAAAHRLAEALRAGGVEAWLDTTELRGGDAWDQKIKKRIRECALFMPIISATTQAREEGYFRLEWKLAVDRTHLLTSKAAFLLPVVIDNTSDRDADVPDEFRSVQWTRLPEGGTRQAFVENVRGLLEAKGARFESPGLISTTPPPTASKAPGKLSPVSIGLIAGLVAAIAFIGWGQFRGANDPAVTATVSAISPTATRPNPASPAEQSVAVLPFVNESSDKEQEYFADGLTETMIGLLSKVQDLRVPARSASFFFKGKNEKIPVMAKELRVAHVLEGTVRKAGNRLRISADLIRADTGYHVWSETYDRSPSDVFAVQDEISAAVVAALKLKLVAAGTNAKVRGTSNVEAYNQYLLGAHYNATEVPSPDAYRRQVAAYRKALALDPAYADAAAKLVLAEAYLADQTGDAAGLKSAIAAAERLPLEHPAHGPSYRIRGAVRVGWQWDWAGALADFQKALALDPSDAAGHYDVSNVLLDLGRFPEAITESQTALALDGLNVQNLGLLAAAQMAMHDYAAADQTTNRIGEIEPHSEPLAAGLSSLRLLQGRLADSLAECPNIRDERTRLVCVAEAQHSLRHRADADKAYADLLKTGTGGNLTALAGVSAWFGNADQAFAWFAKAVEVRESSVTQILADRTLDGLHTDPRWKALLKKINIPG